MPILSRSVDYSILVLFGAALLVIGIAQAVRKKQNLMQLTLWFTLADAGYVVIGIGCGGADGGAGSLVQLLFTGLARLLAFMSIASLGRRAGGFSVDALRGIGREKTVTCTLYAFAMFAAMGVSPFLTPDAKPLVLHAALATGQWVVPFLLVCANIAMVVLTVTSVHPLLFESGRFDGPREGVDGGNFFGLCLAAVLAAMGIFGHGFGALAADITGKAVTQLPDFAPNWHPAVLVPYIGAFCAWYAGKKVRETAGWLSVFFMAIAAVAVLADGTLPPLGRIFALVASGMGFMVALYSVGYIHGDGAVRENTYYFLLLLLFGSLSGLALSENLGGFYVFWELMTFTSYVLVAYEGTKEAHAASVKYFLMCGVAAAVMLPGLLMLSANLGTLNIAELAMAAPSLTPGVASIIALLALVGFGVKAGLVPGHSWLPVAHPAAPSSISAPLSGVLTKAGVFGIVQVFFGIIGVGVLLKDGSTGVPAVGMLVSFLGLATMLYGEVQALRQTDLKRLLAYSTMGQVGELTLILGLASWLATTGALLHLVNHAIMKDLLFFCSGVFILRAGTRELSGLKGLGRAMPFTSLCMVIGLLSILGLPPFAGFISKYLMLYSLASVSPFLAAVMLVASLAGVVYYTRILKTLIFEPYEGGPVKEAPFSVRIVTGLLAALCVLLGVFPEMGLSLVTPAANTMANAGKFAVQTLPLMAIEWPSYTLVLLLGSVVPYILRKDPERAGQATTCLLAASALFVILFGRNLDTLSFLFALAVPVMGAINMWFGIGYMRHSHAQWRFYMFFLLMTGGLTGVAASSDIFNFFLYWEIMSSWSLYFVIVHEENASALREGFKYFFFNVLGAAFLFLGVVLLANWSAGSSFEEIRKAVLGFEHWQLGLVFFVMATGFVMKAAQLPFRIDIQMHPATAPTPVSGYISSVLLKSALFGLAKLFLVLGGAGLVSGVFTLYSQAFIMDIVIWVGGITIVMAASYAVLQNDFKLVLIYSTVSQLGYMVVGVGLGTALGMSGGLLHLFNHMLFKDMLFLTAGAVMAQTGRHSIDAMGGLGAKMPWTMTFFALGALCVIGVPPSNGFTSKWIIYHALMEQGYAFVAVLSLLGSLITLAYFAKLMHAVFLGQPAPGLENVKEAPSVMIRPMAVLAVACILTSVFPGIFLAPINSVLSQFSLTPLDIAPWGLASGRGAWNATATAVLFGVAWYAGRYVLTRRVRKERVSPIHTCGIDLTGLERHTTSRDLYSAPGMLWDKFRKRLNK